jgi:hypothetical protein
VEYNGCNDAFRSFWVDCSHYFLWKHCKCKDGRNPAVSGINISYDKSESEKISLGGSGGDLTTIIQCIRLSRVLNKGMKIIELISF